MHSYTKKKERRVILCLLPTHFGRLVAQLAFAWLYSSCLGGLIAAEDDSFLTGQWMHAKWSRVAVCLGAVGVQSGGCGGGQGARSRQFRRPCAQSPSHAREADAQSLRRRQSVMRVACVASGRRRLLCARHGANSSS